MLDLAEKVPGQSTPACFTALTTTKDKGKKVLWHWHLELVFELGEWVEQDPYSGDLTCRLICIQGNMLYMLAMPE